MLRFLVFVYMKHNFRYKQMNSPCKLDEDAEQDEMEETN